ncbi:uncharacterized protein H6S33_007647 [Morchella sextelata]|uniref:uncharacterized protein n=1 Tax=Morchella sextelata TaxID=1174677 RepID=UPI001D04C548|nr:uncharacterized protein H6S33_007647 [Morchella sextelata]KAH0603325.1 hypothetical protein H6S33_007647 [Morchella sextelata]
MDLPYELCRQLYRDVSAPPSLVGLQRFLEISRDPVLAPLVRTFKYPTDAAVAIVDINWDPHGHVSPDKQGQLWGDRWGGGDYTEIILRQEASAEELQLLVDNNRKCSEQRAFLVSKEHENMLREAVRNLPNLEALNLQLGVFKVDRQLEILVRDALETRPGEIENLQETAPKVILDYTRTPIKTLYLEGSGFIPRFGHVYQLDFTRLQLVMRDITTLCFRFNPPVEPINSHRHRNAESKFFLAVRKYLWRLERIEKLAIIHASPDPSTEAIQPPSFNLSFEIKSPLSAIHTFDLEGLCIYDVNLLKLCARYHTTMKNLSMRRICLVGNWRSVVSDMKKKEDVKLRLETFEMWNVWEAGSATGVKKKLAAEVVRKLVQYLLGPEDSELVLEY